MDVSVTDLRANLAAWLEEVQRGTPVTITDRGLPIAQLLRVGSAGLLQDLMDRGVLGVPESPRRIQASAERRVPIVGQIADLPRDEWR